MSEFPLHPNDDDEREDRRAAVRRAIEMLNAFANQTRVNADRSFAWHSVPHAKMSAGANEDEAHARVLGRLLCDL